MDTEGPITTSSQNKSFIDVIVDDFSHFVVTVPIKSNNAKTACKPFYITGLSNLDLLYILSLIVDQKLLTQIWHIFEHSWVFDTLLEHHIPLRPLDSLTFKVKTLVLIFVFFFQKHSLGLGTPSSYVCFCT